MWRWLLLIIFWLVVDLLVENTYMYLPAPMCPPINLAVVAALWGL